jgi:hypothetical protein
MENAEEQILTYPHRPPDEQREIESFVEAHPEWAPLLHDVRALEGIVPRVDGPDRPTDALLATYVVVQHLHPDEVSPALKDALSNLEGRIDRDPALRERAEAVRRRLEAAEDHVDPVAQFESLTGHALERETDAEEEVTSASAEQASPLSVLDRLLRLPGTVRWAGAAVAVLLGAYGVLYGVSAASQSPLDRLAAPDVSDRVVSSYADTRTRGPATPDTMQVQDVYLEALSLLRGARTSTLGLFPRFDPEKLGRAEQLLTQVTEQTPPSSFLALEAQFYLGKVNLAQRQVDTARAQLRRVVKRDGRQADEARRILRRLQELGAEAQGR